MIKIQLLSKRKVIVRMKIIDRLYSLLILYTVILVGLCLYEICNGIGTNFPILNKFVQIFGYYWASLAVCGCVLRLAMGEPLKVLPKTKKEDFEYFFVWVSNANRYNNLFISQSNLISIRKPLSEISSEKKKIIKGILIFMFLIILLLTE